MIDPDKIAKWQALFAERLKTQHIPTGIGEEGEECTVAAANMAISGKLTDECHPCMSPVITRWIIRIQDRMPDEMRNSDEWKNAAIGLIGSGRDHELERKEIILTWTWEKVLPYLQPIADRIGFGDQWRDLLSNQDCATVVKTQHLARVVYSRALANIDIDTAAINDAADITRAVIDITRANTPYAAAINAAIAAAAAADDDGALEQFWAHVSPARLLVRLIEVGK